MCNDTRRSLDQLKQSQADGSVGRCWQCGESEALQTPAILSHCMGTVNRDILRPWRRPRLRHSGGQAVSWSQSIKSSSCQRLRCQSRSLSAAVVGYVSSLSRSCSPMAQTDHIVEDLLEIPKSIPLRRVLIFVMGPSQVEQNRLTPRRSASLSCGMVK